MNKTMLPESLGSGYEGVGICTIKDGKPGLRIPRPFVFRAKERRSKMNGFEKVANRLAELGIEYELIEHEPALTTEMADSFIEGIEGVRTKTMFLTNKKKSDFYLLIMDDGKRLDMTGFGELSGAKGIRMASENSLFEKMELPPGVVSPFGLINNRERDIKVYIDREIMGEERMSFHPNTNEKTLFIKTEDLLKFLKAEGYEVLTAEL